MVTLEPGIALSLKCTAGGVPLPQITWQFEDSSIPEVTSRVTVGDYVTSGNEVISYVNITSVQLQDSGTYACHVNNQGRVTQHYARVNVLGAPMVRTMKDRVAIEGLSLLIKCPYGGYPIDDIHWEHSKWSLVLVFWRQKRMSSIPFVNSMHAANA